jgi:uncharacterized protein
VSDDDGLVPRFEWDDAKALANIAKHGLDFRESLHLFDGRPVVTIRSDKSGELRYRTLAILKDRCVAMVWTRRLDRIRVISLRIARDVERTEYRSVHGR